MTVVAEGDAAKVVQVRVMTARLGLVGVGEAHDMATISVTKLSGARRGALNAEVRRDDVCKISLPGVRSYDALVPWHRNVKQGGRLTAIREGMVALSPVGDSGRRRGRAAICCNLFPLSF
jgi:hypothetical protein